MAPPSGTTYSKQSLMVSFDKQQDLRWIKNQVHSVATICTT